MALLVIVIVALVMGQTWWDWRDVQRKLPLPRWVGGVALAGILAAGFSGAASMGSMFYQHTVGELHSGFGSSTFWPEAAFLLCGMGVIVAAVRKKSVRSLLLVAGVMAFAFWLGMALYS